MTKEKSIAIKFCFSKIQAQQNEKRFGFFSAAILLQRIFALLFSIIPWHILHVIMALFGKLIHE